MTSHAAVLGRPLQLPRGPVVRNRFFKSAMSEVLATPDGAPNGRLARLYGTWADGGVGLQVTGNVMVDHRALGEPGNVIVEDERHLEALATWAGAGKAEGARIWMQLNHPGKQSPKALSREPVAPSAVPLGPGLSRFFGTPRALLGDEIEDIVGRFATTAAVAKKAGFDGVQIHGAHGYLVSQFLSPHHNRREDEWGGSADNRMRFVLAILAAIRAAVGDNFPVGIKLNSADFQRGGFTEDESMAVVQALVAAGVDLVEISGGSYEAPAMAGARVKPSTLAREAYFLEYATKVRGLVGDVPLVVTGGFRTATAMAGAVSSGAVDMVGLARPLAIEPDLPERVLRGEDFQSIVRPLKTGLSFIDKGAMLEVTWYERQLARMAAGKAPAPDRGAIASLIGTMWSTGIQGLRRRRG